MKYDLRFAKMVLLGMIAVAVIMAITDSLRSSRVSPSNNYSGNNPDKFYLWKTNSSYDYFFTYDPLAADEWLFHTGGRMETNRPKN